MLTFNPKLGFNMPLIMISILFFFLHFCSIPK
nr:MAG TPA: hypothetical protein [Bacteriophage sp.]